VAVRVSPPHHAMQQCQCTARRDTHSPASATSSSDRLPRMHNRTPPSIDKSTITVRVATQTTRLVPASACDALCHSVAVQRVGIVRMYSDHFAGTTTATRGFLLPTPALPPGLTSTCTRASASASRASAATTRMSVQAKQTERVRCRHGHRERERAREREKRHTRAFRHTGRTNSHTHSHTFTHT
jgi:hypothetical protein